jgi:hypothetical protein
MSHVANFLSCHPRVGGDLCLLNFLAFMAREISACTGMTELGVENA